MTGGGFEQISKFTQSVGANGVSLVRTHPQPRLAFIGRNVEAIEPKIDHHFFQVAARGNRLKNTGLTGVFDGLLGSLLQLPSGFVVVGFGLLRAIVSLKQFDGVEFEGFELAQLPFERSRQGNIFRVQLRFDIAIDPHIPNAIEIAGTRTVTEAVEDV